jgi:hypothetical protein
MGISGAMLIAFTKKSRRCYCMDLLVNSLDISHEGVCFSPVAFNHDLCDARPLYKQVLGTTDSHGVSADARDDAFIQFARLASDLIQF